MTGISCRITVLGLYQLIMVGSQVVGVGVGEEEQLGVGMDGEVGLDGGLVAADKVGHILDLDLRLGDGATVGITTGVGGGSQLCGHTQDTEELEKTGKHLLLLQCLWKKT